MFKLYLIPKNVSQRFEFFPGFGWVELFLTLAGFGVGVLLFLIAGIFTSSLARSLITVFTTGLGFMLGKGDPRTGKTILSFVEDFKSWRMRQRRYLYYFGTGDKYDV